MDFFLALVSLFFAGITVCTLLFFIAKLIERVEHIRFEKRHVPIKLTKVYKAIRGRDAKKEKK